MQINNEVNSQGNLQNPETNNNTQVSYRIDDDPIYLRINTPEVNLTDENANIQQTTNTRNPNCPTVTTRIDNTLHLVFPFCESLKCTETGCKGDFVIQKWYSMKQSITHHLRDYHNFEDNEIEVERWCKLCGTNISLLHNINKHPCFRTTPIYPPDDEAEHQHKCDECRRSFPTTGGLRKHKVAKHPAIQPISQRGISSGRGNGRNRNSQHQSAPITQPPDAPNSSQELFAT